MRYILIALFVLCSCIHTWAQQHRVYADVGLPVGFSATYNYTLAKHWAIGAGIQAYDIYPSAMNERKFTPNVFADIRFNMRPEKNNQFFSFFDLGVNFFKLEDNYARDSVAVYHITNNSVSTGLGFAYLRRATKRGGGPYASLKLVMNWHTMHIYNILSEANDFETLAGRGGGTISIGFKF